MSIVIVHTWMRIQSSGDDGFVFNGVQGTSGIDDATIGFEHAHGALKDTNLKPWRTASEVKRAQKDAFGETNPCNPLPSKDCQRFQMPTFFRSVPSPLHGTSQRIRSNKS